MTKIIYFQKILMAFLTLMIVAAMATPTYAADDNTGDPFDRFGEFTEGSDWAISHAAWDTVLTSSVMIIPPSTRIMANVAKKPKTGTRISRGSASPARFESNRVGFHLLKKEHMDMVSKYRQELENLPNRYPLREFSKNEQLAYWLNLHNALVFEKITKQYPFSTLKKFRETNKDSPAFWNQKLVTVEGVPLSLNDIQNKILIRHWKSPMVLYGLYQGAIGGPSLSYRAFTGKNVHSILREKANEFINSNRGFRGNKVSLIYEWGKTAFPDWENDLTRHLASFAIPEFREKLRNTRSLTSGLYDWNIADIMGGTLSLGPIDSTAANLLTLSHPGQAIGGGIIHAHNILGDLNRSGMINVGGYNQNTLDLFREVARKWEDTPAREGFVSSEECGVDDCPEIESDQDAPEDLPAETPDGDSDPEDTLKLAPTML